MPRLALEIADIFRAHGPAWRRAEAGHLSLGQLKVMSAIEHCRYKSGRAARRHKIPRERFRRVPSMFGSLGVKVSHPTRWR